MSGSFTSRMREVDRRVRARQDRQRLLRGLGAEDLVALALEHELQRAADVLLVVDDENGLLRRGPGGGYERSVGHDREPISAVVDGDDDVRARTSNASLLHPTQVVLRRDDERRCPGSASRSSSNWARASVHLCILRYVSPRSSSASGSRPEAVLAGDELGGVEPGSEVPERVLDAQRPPRRSCPFRGRSGRRRARGAPGARSRRRGARACARTASPRDSRARSRGAPCRRRTTTAWSRSSPAARRIESLICAYSASAIFERAYETSSGSERWSWTNWRYSRMASANFSCSKSASAMRSSARRAYLE